MVNKAGLMIIVLLIISLFLTACSDAEYLDADYTDIEIHMTYSEVVDILGEQDSIYETYPGYSYNTRYYVWNFDDGNMLYVHLGYPGAYMNDIYNPMYPDDYVVHYYYVVNESLVPTTEPSTEPTE